eukprot:UN27658
MEQWQWPLVEPAKELEKDIDKNMDGMKEKLTDILKTEQQVVPGDDVLLMVLNAGYYYHFANWACSTEQNEINVRKYTMVVVFDEDTRKRVSDAGFMAYLLDWYKIDPGASHTFGRGPHFI